VPLSRASSSSLRTQAQASLSPLLSVGRQQSSQSKSRIAEASSNVTTTLHAHQKGPIGGKLPVTLRKVPVTPGEQGKIVLQAGMSKLMSDVRGYVPGYKSGSNRFGAGSLIKVRKTRTRPECTTESKVWQDMWLSAIETIGIFEKFCSEWGKENGIRIMLQRATHSRATAPR
jgi:hypothetical protein